MKLFENLSTFQIVLIAVFSLAAVVGIILFATGFIDVGGKNETLPPVVIWGTLPKETIEPVISALKTNDDRFSQVSYVEKDARTYDDEFVNALAAGRGPDLVLLPETSIMTHRDKLIGIPFDTYSARTFRDTFVEAGEVFLLSGQGTLALPFSINPMVMYWNRDILASKNVVTPPAFWDEFFTLAPKITERDRASNIVKSFAALGEYRNVVHAKDILSALILQTGNPIVALNDNAQGYSTLKEQYNFVEPPALAALRFYTEFSNPVKSVYSWNRALPDSRHSFLAGDLALYFGFASEFAALKAANPNLNIDVAVLPRSRDASRSITLAHVTGFAIPRGANDISASFTVALALTGAPYEAHFSELSGLPPVRRDLLSQEPTDIVGPVFYTSAVASKTWLDPNPAATEGVYQRMIESTLSGAARLNEAIDTADAELNNLLR